MKQIDLSNEVIPDVDLENFAPLCVELYKPRSYYTPNFKMVHIKNYLTGDIKRNLILDDDVIKLFEHKDIYNVYYFRVWGDVQPHKDPTGYELNYPSTTYSSVLIPIDVPKNLDTFYNGTNVSIKEGDLLNWDVVNSIHSWKFKYTKHYFNILHINFNDFPF